PIRRVRSPRPAPPAPTRPPRVRGSRSPGRGTASGRPPRWNRSRRPPPSEPGREVRATGPRAQPLGAGCRPSARRPPPVSQRLLVPGDVPVAPELPALLGEHPHLAEAEPLVQPDRRRVG